MSSSTVYLVTMKCFIFILLLSIYPILKNIKKNKLTSFEFSFVLVLVFVNRLLTLCRNFFPSDFIFPHHSNRKLLAEEKLRLAWDHSCLKLFTKSRTEFNAVG